MKFLQEVADGAGTEEELPQALRNRPKLNQFQAPYWRAYSDISGSRQYTASGCADIPYSEKVSWLNENGIDCPDERRDFMEMISLLDGIFLNDHYEKSKVK